MPAARGFTPDDRRTSAHVNSAPLGCFLGWRFWLCRKLKHRCLLPFAQICQENTGAIRKLEGIVMHPRLVFVDLPKDRRPEVYRFRPPRGEAKGGGGAFHLLGKSKLCSRKNAHRRCGILRRSKPSSTSVEVHCPKLVTDLGRPRFDVVETVVTHGRGAPLTWRSPHPFLLPEPAPNSNRARRCEPLRGPAGPALRVTTAMRSFAGTQRRC